MLTWENCVEAQALRRRGWSISAIANHLGHDRKTIRAYLNGERRPGERKPARAEALGEFVEYCRRRLADDPHVWLTTLFDEVVDLGYRGFVSGVHRVGAPAWAAAAVRGVRRREDPGPRGDRASAG